MSNKQSHFLKEDIAIIGIGCIYPKAPNRDKYWDNLVNKVDGIVEVPKNRWDIDVYYHPDRTIPDKTYQKIGGFVDEIDEKAFAVKYKIPPKTVEAMDKSQKYAIIAAAEALNDSGYDSKDFDRERTAVVIGNSMGGDQIDYTNLRAFYGGIEDDLKKCGSFARLDEALKKDLIEELGGRVKGNLPTITEDSLPGELANVIAGRMANVFNLRGPNFSVDAACASSIAALSAAVKGLSLREYDMVMTGGSDFLMGPGPYIKFSKIGALSPDGSRPFDAGANGFVMGEGSGIFILKRVSDARRDGDKIYAIIRGIGASSDGKGKGITAPNPKGQILAVERAFENAGYTPNSVQVVEAHGTATSVGDLIEVESLCKVWNNDKVKNNSVALGSVKSMIGHLKAAAASASIIKMALALHKKTIPPSINYETPNPEVNFGNIPFRVITEPEDWPEGINGNPRRANVSAFGFGGTNFHVAFEEDTGDNGVYGEEKKYYSSGYDSNVPDSGYIMGSKKSALESSDNGGYELEMSVNRADIERYAQSESERLKLEGESIIIGGSSWDEVKGKMDDLRMYIKSKKINGGDEYSIRMIDLSARLNMDGNGKDYRLGISAVSVGELFKKLDVAEESLYNHKKRIVLKNKGIFYGEKLKSNKGNLGKIGFLFPGQGSQYTNMMKDLYMKYRVVKETYDEADEIMKGIIGKRISEIIFIKDDAGKEERREAEESLKQTEVAQPAILTANIAIYRLLVSFGVKPDVVVGHSLGEYGALVSSGVLRFKDALYAVSARGREIANVQIDDVGKMASIAGGYEKVEEILKEIDGYVITANKNCYSQTVIAGDSKTILKAIKVFESKGMQAQEIPVSHAFHSQIVAPACVPYRKVLESLQINSPDIDILANLNAEYYPKGDNIREEILDILEKHIANPVEFIQQIERMYDDGVRIFLEVGPKRALTSFVLNIIDKRPHLGMATNHPKRGGINTINDSLAAITAYGYDLAWNGINLNGTEMGNPNWRFRDGFLNNSEQDSIPQSTGAEAVSQVRETKRVMLDDVEKKEFTEINNKSYTFDIQNRAGNISTDNLYKEFQEKQKELMKDVLDVYSKKSEELFSEHLKQSLYYKSEMEKHNINLEKVVISGVSIGLPGMSHSVFGDNTFDRILNGENMIEPLVPDEMERMVNKNITRLVKSSQRDAHFHTISNSSEVVKLAGRKGRFNFEDEYGVDPEIAESFDITTKLAISAGIEALRDAGIPLTMNYKETTTGGVLPSHWGLSESMEDETGVIFASSFPGFNSLVEEVSKNLAYKYGSKSKRELFSLYTKFIENVKDEKTREELTDWYAENHSMLKNDMGEDGVYQFNRKFILRMLPMGHSQFAQYIKAKGPNVQINVACSSTVAAVGMAEDWIRTGRAKRVIIIAADDVTSNDFLEWILSGFLAVGAVSTEGDVTKAAVPFDRRRNGMIVGMGALSIIVEAESELKKRGMDPIVEVIATEYSNSGFHGTRLDVDHIVSVMNRLLGKVEKVLNLKKEEIADKLVFMSHETYTPARGGSASAEIKSLKTNFGDSYKDIVITNTKGYTGHPMAAGVEDAIVVRALQTGKIPPIANYKEVDHELGELNLSKGGFYKNLKYALRLGAGFGSQIAMSFLKLVSADEKRIVEQEIYNKWLSAISGVDNPELEIVNRTLRIKDDGSVFEKKKLLNKDRASVKEASRIIDVPQIDRVEIPVEVVTHTEVQDSANAATVGRKEVEKKILKIVSEKTGYPDDLIEFDLDMESDLGIDTVKQAEMFGMIREVFNIPQEEGLKIKDFPTLNHVVEYMWKRSPDFNEAPVTASTAVEVETSGKPASAAGGKEIVSKKIVEIVADKTGYPEDLIEFDLDMESDLGIDTVKQAEMFGMIREVFEIPQQEGLKIKDFPTLNHVIEYMWKKSTKFKDEPVAALPVNEKETAASEVSSGAGTDAVTKKIVEIVADKTGYPEDLIEFDLDMESDLGIDTVKQAEMFGMMREFFNIPQQEGLKIKDFPTLSHVINFMKDKSPDYIEDEPATAVAEEKPQALAATATEGMDAVTKKIVEIVADKTGYPEDLIEFDLDMESDLGIDTVKQAEMFGMMRELFNVPQQEGLKIKDFPTLSHVIKFMKDKSPDYIEDEPAAAVAEDNPAASAANAVEGMDAVTKKIVEIVADKTGYPEDLIEFDLDMESDLGIDTVKQAEMFGMMREFFNIPQQEGLKIKDFPTLNHVIKFMKEKSRDYKVEEPLADGAEEKATVQAAAHESKIKRMTVEIIDDPIDLNIDPAFNLEGFNIIITDDGRGISKSLSKILTDNKANVQIIEIKGNETEDDLISKVEKAKEQGKINGIVHLTALADSKGIDDISFDEWREGVSKNVKGLFLIVKSLHKDLIDNAESNKAFIVCATQMGGSFGFENFSAPDPIGGGVTGLAKSLNKELSKALVKSIDFSMKGKPASIAKTIFNEIQFGGARVEAGYSGKKRMIPQVIDNKIDSNVEPKIDLGNNPVFIITGGGYGITGEIAKDISEFFKPRIAIISREGLPSNIEELASLDEKGLQELKDRIVNKLKSTNDRVTPVMIEKEFGKYTKAIDKYKNIQVMEKLGAESVEYFACNVGDYKGMSGTIKNIRDKYGKIDVIIHGAGIEQSKLLEDKKYEDFCRVIDVKADGCFNLVELTKNDNVKALVTFSSVSGRFGNIGQTDYSAANDILNKYVQQANKRFGNRMKAVSLNWGAWKEVGMATRGSVMKVLEEAGVEMISLDEGVTRVREDILFGGESEVIISGGVGALDSDGIMAGEKSKEFLKLESAIKSKKDEYPLIDEIISFQSGEKMAVKKRLDPEVDIYLKDHSIDNVPYFPAVMGIESFSEVARLLFPEMGISAMQNVHFKIPIKILKHKPVDIIISLEKIESKDDKTQLFAKIETEFFNKEGIKLGENKIHFTADIILTDGKIEVTKPESDGINMEKIAQYLKDGEVKISDEEIYKRFFHGPKFQVHDGVLEIDQDTILGTMGIRKDDIFKFTKKPRLISSPLTIEAALQNAGVYGMAKKNKTSLPDTIAELVFRKIPDKVDRLFVMARYMGSDDGKHIYDTEIVDSSGNIYSVMKGYKMINTGELEEGDRF